MASGVMPCLILVSALVHCYLYYTYQTYRVVYFVTHPCGCVHFSQPALCRELFVVADIANQQFTNDVLLSQHITQAIQTNCLARDVISAVECRTARNRGGRDCFHDQQCGQGSKDLIMRSSGCWAGRQQFFHDQLVGQEEGFFMTSVCVRREVFS